MLYPSLVRENDGLDVEPIDCSGEFMTAVAYAVYEGDKGWILDVFNIPAHSEEAAEQKVMRWLKWRYSECGGFIGHRVKAQKITDTQLKNLGYYRCPE